MKRIYVLIAAVMFSGHLFAQDVKARGKITLDFADEEPAINEETAEVSVVGKYYGLLIGIEEYQDPKVNDLDKPIDDINNMYDLLTEKYTFDKENVKRLENPTREEMIVALDQLNNDITSNDNLLIFYAGHGYYNEQTKQGYWLPSDAQNIESKNTSRWFRNSTLVDYISSIPSKHTLLISDACFSGSIFKTRAAFDNASIAYFKIYRLKSRKAMTSGSLKTVSDNSVFLKYLMARLKDNLNKYTTSEELFSKFKIAVMNNSNNVPRYGEIQNSGDEGGDFLFIRRN